MNEFLDYFSFDGDGHLPCLELSNPFDLDDADDEETGDSTRQ